jgi:hypothetical protein
MEKFRYVYEQVLYLWKSSGMFMNYAIAVTLVPPPLLDLWRSSGTFMNKFWIFGKVQKCLLNI